MFKSRTLPTSSSSRWLKCLLTITAVAPFFLAFVKHPATNVPGESDLNAMSVGAIGQWICVISLLSFFVSYYSEFSGIRRERVQRGGGRCRTAIDCSAARIDPPTPSRTDTLALVLIPSPKPGHCTTGRRGRSSGLGGGGQFITPKDASNIHESEWHSVRVQRGRGGAASPLFHLYFVFDIPCIATFAQGKSGWF